MNSSDRCFFLYGTLKPGQIAFYKIEGLIDSNKTIDAKLEDHYLAVRDGLPFAYSSKVRSPSEYSPDQLMPVSGVLVYPKDGHEDDLREEISRYENHALYKEDICSVATSLGESVEATFYSAKKAAKREVTEVCNGTWRIIDDPILGYGLPRLVNEIHKMKLEKAETFPADMHDAYWSLMWKIQGSFANLNSVLEHFCRFYFGAKNATNESLDGMDKLWSINPKRMGVIVPRVRAHNAKEASDSTHYDSQDKPFRTWYQVRSNMVHSGKDGYKDLEKIRDSTVGMARVLPEIILYLVPEFQTPWGRLND